MSAKSWARNRGIEVLEKRTLLASSGLSATYYQNTDLTGASSTEIDPSINMNWGSNSVPAGLNPKTNSFSAQWTGTIQPKFSETYTFQILAAGGVRLWVNGQLLIDRWSEVADAGADANADGIVNALDFNVLASNYGTRSSAGQSAGDFTGDGVVDSRDFSVLASEYGQSFVAHDSGTISLRAGENYAIEMDFFQASGPASAKLSWASNSQPLQVIPSADLLSQTPNAISYDITDPIAADSFNDSGSATSRASLPDSNAQSSDIETEPTTDSGGGYDVSQLKPGDWMDYLVNVPTAGTFDLNLRVASLGQGGTLHLNVDGSDVSGTVTVPDTGGWQSWTTLTVPQIALTAGQHILRLVMDTAGASGATASINWLGFQPSTNPATPAAASNLTETVLTATQIQLNWKDNSSNETGFKIERSTDGLHFSLVTTVAANATSFTDTNLSGATAYSYLVLATNAQGDAAPSNIRSATTAAVIAPGSGFTGPTTQPATINPTAQFGDAEAIARWDVVPYQTFDKEFNVGVVAFHAAGIDRVDFSVNGGDWVAVRQMTMNPQTGVAEYWATMRASDFADGQVELRSIAYPVVGLPRVLDPMIVLANSNHSVGQSTVTVSLTGHGDYSNLWDAMNAVAPGGQIVLLDEGTYMMDVGGIKYNSGIQTSTGQYVTIRAADGLNRDNVVIGRSTKGTIVIKAPMIHFQDVSFNFDNVTQIDLSIAGTKRLWLDNCRWFSTKGTSGDWTGYNEKLFSADYIAATDCRADDVLLGFDYTDLARNVELDHVYGDLFYNPGLLVNATIGVNPGGLLPWHSDTVQLYGNAPAEDVIVYNVNATGLSNIQKFFTDWKDPAFAVTDCAFVNMSVNDYATTTTATSQLGGLFNNVLFKNITHEGINFTFRDDGNGVSRIPFTAHDVVFEDDVFSKVTRGVFGETGLPDGVTMERVHLINPAFISSSDVEDLTTGTLVPADLGYQPLP